MAFLRAFGAYLPPRVVTNEELAARIARTPEWILGATGIVERRWAAPEVSVANLAVWAARDCLARGGVKPVEIGLVLLASASAEQRFPGPAALAAQALGIAGVPAIDLPMASAGSLFGIALASTLTAAYENVLVIGAEKLSAVIEGAELDPNTAILFGDGAGACLVSAERGGWRVIESVMHSDGAYADALRLPMRGGVSMDGLTVILHATRKIPAVIAEVLARARRKADEVDHFVLHQANLNLLLRIAKALGVPTERFVSNIARYGNTSSASMLIAAAEAEFTGPLLCLAAFGAGFHWGAVLAERTGG